MADRSDFIRQRRSLITICLIFYFIYFKNVEFKALQILGNIIEVDNPSQTVFQILWIGFIYWSLRYYQYFRAFGDKGIKRVFWDHMNKFLGDIALKQFKKSKEFIDNYRDKEKIVVYPQITSGERYSNGYSIKVIVAKQESNRRVPQFEKKEKIAFYNLIKPRIRSSIYVTLNTHLVTDYILPIVLFIPVCCYGIFWLIIRINLWHFILIYFNWLLGLSIWGFNRWRKSTTKGLNLIVTGSLIELFAFFIHWIGYIQLKGESDQLYIWILPFGLSLIALIFIISGVVRSFSK